MRLRKRREFVQVQTSGKRHRAKHFLALVVEQPGPSRVGLTVSTKVGNAVVRNRVRRHMREWLRRQLWPQDLAVVLVAQPSAARLSSTEIGADLLLLRGGCSC